MHKMDHFATLSPRAAGQRDRPESCKCLLYNILRSFSKMLVPSCPTLVPHPCGTNKSCVFNIYSGIFASSRYFSKKTQDHVLQRFIYAIVYQKADVNSIGFLRRFVISGGLGFKDLEPEEREQSCPSQPEILIGLQSSGRVFSKANLF